MNVPASSGRENDKQVVIGKINGIHGVRGWVKVFSYSRPRENIFSYQTWLLGIVPKQQARRVVEHRQQGKNLLALLEGIDNRELAQTLIGMEIAVDRQQLPDLTAGEYYWRDLLNMEVVDSNGRSFGRISDIQETGANDVLVVESDRRYLIPLVYEEIVQDVDLENGCITVDWNPDYI